MSEGRGALPRDRRPPDTGAGLLLIEGIPGGGKSTAAQLVCEHGLASGWTEELAKPHPLLGPARPGEPAERERRWLARCERLAAVTAGARHVLDAAFLQGMLRFPWSERASLASRIDLALRLLDALAPARPRLVWLAPVDPGRHLREFVLPLRGAEWERRLCRYAASTELGRHHGWSGRDGLVDFWLAYHADCERLLERLGIPLLRVPVTADDFGRVAPAIGGWLAGDRTRR